jgi:hypothetical protein
MTTSSLSHKRTAEPPLDITRPFMDDEPHTIKEKAIVVTQLLHFTDAGAR